MEASNSNGTQLQLSTPPPSQDLTPVHQQSPAQTPVQEQSPAQIPVQVQLRGKTPVQVQFSAQAPSTQASSSNSQPEHVLSKSRLQQYTQKSGIPFPVYQTVNEGFQHAPRFRSSVLVDGVCYSSPNTFPAQKAAEQDVARLAMTNITERIKDVEVPLIHEVFCKSILNEYAMKKNMENPIYNTVHTPGLLPAFISTLVFNGVSYTGNVGKRKKDAEQLVARVVIQSLKDDFESRPIISEIIRPKYKLDVALHKIKDPQYAHASLVPPAVNPGNSSAISTSAPIVPLPEASFGMLPPHHEFIKRKPEEPAYQATLQLPITFVPSIFKQPLGFVLNSMGISPTSLGIAPTYFDTGNSFVISNSAPIVALRETSLGMHLPRHEFIKRKPEESISQVTPSLL